MLFINRLMTLLNQEMSTYAGQLAENTNCYVVAFESVCQDTNDHKWVVGFRLAPRLDDSRHSKWTMSFDQ